MINIVIITDVSVQHPAGSASNAGLSTLLCPPTSLQRGPIPILSYTSHTLLHNLFLIRLFHSQPLGLLSFITISCIAPGILLLSEPFICLYHFIEPLCSSQYRLLFWSIQEIFKFLILSLLVTPPVLLKNCNLLLIMRVFCFNALPSSAVFRCMC